MQYMVDNLGVDTYHRANFCHELPGGFPFWAFAHLVTPHRLNQGEELLWADAGTCIVYPPGYPRYLYCPEGQDGVCNNWIHFSCDDDARFIEILNDYGIPINRFFTLRQYMPVISILQELIYEQHLELPHKAEMSSLLVGQMLLQISRNILPYHEKADTNALTHLHSFELLRKQVYSVPEKDWTVSTMASQVYLGANQFISLYRTFFDVTPKQDLINARVAKAKTLLSTNPQTHEHTMTLHDVALLCGFKNEYYFSSTFRRIVGIPPGQYARVRDE